LRKPVGKYGSPKHNADTRWPVGDKVGICRRSKKEGAGTTPSAMRSMSSSLGRHVCSVAIWAPSTARRRVERKSAGCKIQPCVSATEQPTPFGILLRRFRLAAGLTQAELAEHSGLSLRGVSDLERGARRAPHPHTVRQLAAALHLTDHESGLLLRAARGVDALEVEPSAPAESQAPSRSGLGSGAPADLAALDFDDQLSAEPPPTQPSISVRLRQRAPIVLTGAIGVVAIVVGLVVVVPRTGLTATPVTVATRASAASDAGELVLADSLADPTNPAFPREQSGSSPAAFSDGTSATYQWDAAYMYSALVAHVLGPYPPNSDHAWLEAGVILDRPVPQDFAIQVRGRVTRSPEASAFGLAFEAAPDQMYEFDVTPAEQGYRLELAQGQSPAADGQSNWILPPSQPNLLRVEVRGDTLRVLANGHELARAGPPQLADRQGGKVSLRWAMTGPPSEGNSVEIRFAQFALYALP
jgi:transcriptional regulator with XRE-family HTH domain